LRDCIESAGRIMTETVEERAELRVLELKATQKHRAIGDILLTLTNEGYVNPYTLKPYTYYETRVMYNEGDIVALQEAIYLAQQSKINGLTNREIHQLLKSKGYINAMTGKPYGYSTISGWNRGINKQSGRRGETYKMSPDELAERKRLQRLKHNRHQREHYYRNRERILAEQKALRQRFKKALG
jgi:hypothetical protein